MAHLFGIGGNPFGTQIGQLIEKSTDGTQASENWALFLEICDLINEQEDGPKDSIKAVKKRLSHNAGKNYQVVMYTLTLLETMVKNCGRRMHNQVANKDFLGEMIKIIGPKNDPPQIVQEKVLSLIQTWADAFQGISDLKEVNKVYQDLKHKGIEFPPTDLDHMVPIHTPARTAPGSDPPVPVPQRVPSGRGPPGQVARSPPRAHTMPYPQAQMAHHPPPPAPPTGPVMLAPEQLAKLKSELDIVQQNIKVFSEMLTELTPGQESPADLELLQDLSRTCRQMQHRIVDLVERVQNEEVTGELLHMNDEMNNVFLRYERFERMRSTQLAPLGNDQSAMPAAQQPLPPALQPPPGRQAMTAGPPPPYSSGGDNAIANLIDLDDSPSPASAANPSDISVRLADMNLGSNTVSGTLNQLSTTTATNAGPDDEFDMFAQSRTSFDQSKNTPAGSAYVNQMNDQFGGQTSLGAAVSAKAAGNTQQLIDKESDYDEMQKWLEQNPAQTQDSATSSEFDRFLADRVQEVSNEPDSNAAQIQQQPRSGRQMQKDDTENALFAL